MPYGLGLGKNRSKLGKWLDKNGLTQEWLVRSSGLGRSTVGYLVTADADHAPNAKTMQKILNAIRKVDPNKKASDFWDI